MSERYEALKQQLKDPPQSLTIDAEHYPDLPRTIQSFINYCDNNPGNRIFLPYFNKLEKIAECIQSTHPTTRTKK